MDLVAEALAEGGAPGTAAGCFSLQPALSQESFYLSLTFIQQTEGHLPPGCWAWEELVIHTPLLCESVCGASSQPCQPRHSLPPSCCGGVSSHSPLVCYALFSGPSSVPKRPLCLPHPLRSQGLCLPQPGLELSGRPRSLKWCT